MEPAGREGQRQGMDRFSDLLYAFAGLLSRKVRSAFRRTRQRKADRQQQCSKSYRRPAGATRSFAFRECVFHRPMDMPWTSECLLPTSSVTELCSSRSLMTIAKAWSATCSLSMRPSSRGCCKHRPRPESRRHRANQTAPPKTFFKDLSKTSRS